MLLRHCTEVAETPGRARRPRSQGFRADKQVGLGALTASACSLGQVASLAQSILLDGQQVVEGVAHGGQELFEHFVGNAMSSLLDARHVLLGHVDGRGHLLRGEVARLPQRLEVGSDVPNPRRAGPCGRQTGGRR